MTVDVPATAATVLASEVSAAFSPAALVNHCSRAYLFAAALARLENLTVDLELLYVAAMVHDLALETEFDNHTLAFEIAGGHVGWVFAAGAGWPSSRRDRVRDVVVAHMRDTSPASDTEGYLLAAATSLDIVGDRLDDWPRDFVEETLRRHPRLDLSARFSGCFTDQAARKPDTAAARSVCAGLPARLAANPLNQL